MAVDVLVGLQWGDEGKGKVVDVLTPQYKAICRFQGGPNAGHTLEFNKIKHVLHTIPSGIFRPETLNIIGNGVVIDPVIFQKEVEGIEKLGIDIRNILYISKRASIIMPTHRLIDAASEAAKGANKIGSTLKGISPAYIDRVGRNAFRVGDILNRYEEKYQQITNGHKELLLKQYNFTETNEEYEAQWKEGIEFMKDFQLVDSEHLLGELLEKGCNVLAEGAQGSLLDVDFGTYPFVTSSNTLSAGACTGLGIAPNKIDKVIGIFKAYCTRVGMGPFPTELHDATGEKIRELGHEFGATTGRTRRCGWLDLVALKYTIMLNGVTELCMMKADVLNGFDTVKVAVAYEIDGKQHDKLPYELDTNITPIYKEFAGWTPDMKAIFEGGALPDTLKDYIRFIEKETGVPVKIISMGPNRSETIRLN